MPSTVIKKFDYSKEDKSLVVEFTTGKVYVYRQVPEEVFNQMKSAFAKGIFFNNHIKDKYTCEKLK